MPEPKFKPCMQDLQLLVQRLLELHRGAGLREPQWHNQREPDVLQLHLPGDDIRDALVWAGRMACAWPSAACFARMTKPNAFVLRNSTDQLQWVKWMGG